jgi:hypothetical protein
MPTTKVTPSAMFNEVEMTLVMPSNNQAQLHGKPALALLFSLQGKCRVGMSAAAHG